MQLNESTGQIFEEIVRSRRSVRVFTKELVPESIVKKCLELSLLAPNSSNLQPWEFHWIRNENLKKKIATICLDQPAASTAAELIVILARTETWKNNRSRMLEAFGELEKKTGDKIPQQAWDYYKKLVPFVYKQGPLGIFGLFKRVLVWILGFFRVIPREPTSPSDLKAWAIKSTALAAENFMLAASAFGYDTCPMEGFDSVRLRKLLKLPKDATPIMIIGMGKRAPNGIYGPQIRFDSNYFIFERT